MQRLFRLFVSDLTTRGALPHIYTFCVQVGLMLLQKDVCVCVD